MVNGFDSLELLDKKLRHQVSVHLGIFGGGGGSDRDGHLKIRFLFYFIFKKQISTGWASQLTVRSLFGIDLRLCHHLLFVKLHVLVVLFCFSENR